MSIAIFMAVLFSLAIGINRYFSFQNKKKFAEVDARLAKEQESD